MSNYDAFQYIQILRAVGVLTNRPDVNINKDEITETLLKQLQDEHNISTEFTHEGRPDYFFAQHENVVKLIDKVCVSRIDVDEQIKSMVQTIEKQKNVIDTLNEDLATNINKNLTDIHRRERKVIKDIL